MDLAILCMSLTHFSMLTLLMTLLSKCINLMSDLFVFMLLFVTILFNQFTNMINCYKLL